jgi:hypothetical protein
MFSTSPNEFKTSKLSTFEKEGIIFGFWLSETGNSWRLWKAAARKNQKRCPRFQRECKSFPSEIFMELQSTISFSLS